MSWELLQRVESGVWLGWQEEASAYIGAFLDGLVNGVAVTIHIHFHRTPFASSGLRLSTDEC